MYEAHLHDPIHGEVRRQAATEEEAVELAFQELAKSWMHPDDAARWPVGEPMFDGEIRGHGEVWSYNRAWWLLGTVYEVNDPCPRCTKCGARADYHMSQDENGNDVCPACVKR